jgi:hypothetical protein
MKIYKNFALKSRLNGKGGVEICCDINLSGGFSI